ncbi:unnamed protein product [Somion occarium]|uniref:Uncharacterized protein n=1 Tax=Somion occarium TaxID=3059160 RepID=A0ABP1CQH0_9APHY
MSTRPASRNIDDLLNDPELEYEVDRAITNLEKPSSVCITPGSMVWVKPRKTRTWARAKVLNFRTSNTPYGGLMPPKCYQVYYGGAKVWFDGGKGEVKPCTPENDEQVALVHSALAAREEGY